MSRVRSAGWYADPVTVGAARYWDGRGWTTSVSWGGTTLKDPTPLDEVERQARRRDDAITIEYLDDAVERGVLQPEVATVLRNDLLRGCRQEPVALESAGTARPPPAQPDQHPHALPPPVPGIVGPAPASAPAAVAPARVAGWWDDAKSTMRSDLALHGIAYLGVLMLFAGVTGLIVFSFGDVAPWVRSLTELMVPAAMFLAAWYLSSRNAKVVGDALAVLGAAVTPIIVAAAWTDGAPIPPDVDGRLLPIVQGLSMALIALAMAAVSRRHPSTPVRFLVGPTLWLGAGLAAAALRDPVPTGYETARPDAYQLAIVLAAVALTMLVCKIRGSEGPIGSAMTTVALPAAGIVYVLELVLAGGEGWPAGSTVVTGLAGLLLLEASSSRLSSSTSSSLQFAVVGVTALRLSSVVEPQWVAVASFPILLALLEYTGQHRRDRVAVWVGLAAATTALLATLAEPVTAAIGFGALTIWGLWRYLAPVDWVPARDVYGLVPAAGVIVTTGALWQMVEPGVAVVTSAAAVLLLAITGRLSKPIAADALWGWFVPAAAAIVTFAGFGYEWGTLSTELAIAGSMASAALALSCLPLAARVWASSGALVWALANAAEALEIGRDAQAVALGTGGIVLVVASLAVARPPCVHFAAVGHLAGLVALTIPTWPGWASATVSVLAATGWWATTLVDNHGEAIHLRVVRNALGPHDSAQVGSIDITAELAGLAALSLTVVTAASAILAVDASIEPAWVALACAAGILLDAVAVRLVHWTRARRRVFEWATFAGAVVAAVAVISATAHLEDDWSAIITTAIGFAVIALATSPRPAAFVWTAWVGGAAITVLLGNRLGLAQDVLDTLLVAWGAIVLVGGAGVQRHRHGPVPQARFGSDRQLLPPIVLGTAAFAIGGMSTLTAGSATAIGWASAAMALIVLTVALLLPLGAIAAIAEVLATLSYALLAPWNPIERPATFVPWVLLLLAAALLTRRPRAPWPTRWDLASFWVANVVGGYALALAVVTDTVATTFTLFAALSIAVAVVLRRFEWAIAAAILLLVAGVDAGSGWLALVLAIEGVVLTGVGLRRAATERWLLVSAGAGALVGAWFDAVLWLGWSVGTVLHVTVPVAAAVAFAAAVGFRLHLVPVAPAVVWSATGALVSVGSMIGGADEVPRLAGGLTFAASVLLLAATAAALVPLLGAVMRWLAAGSAAAAWLPAAWAVEPSEWIATAVGTCAALGALVTVLALHGMRPKDPWVAPGSMYAVATQALAALAALATLPDNTLVVVVLLAVSGELIALGVIHARPELFVVAPAVACGAWVLGARDTLAGQPNWFTIPIGFTMLVMVGLVRWIRRGRGAAVTGFDVIAVEFVGMSVMAGPPIAEVLAGSLWNALVAVVIGMALANWGALTRVRRRAAFGAVTVVLATVLVIGVPLSNAVTWRGPALWMALSLLGIAAIIVASTLERGRDAVRQASRRLDEMTAGWERIPRTHPVNHPVDTPTDATRRDESHPVP